MGLSRLRPQKDHPVPLPEARGTQTGGSPYFSLPILRRWKWGSGAGRKWGGKKVGGKGREGGAEINFEGQRRFDPTRWVGGRGPGGARARCVGREGALAGRAWGLGRVEGR